jgi:hypothetical protein
MQDELNIEDIKSSENSRVGKSSDMVSNKDGRRSEESQDSKDI